MPALLTKISGELNNNENKTNNNNICLPLNVETWITEPFEMPPRGSFIFNSRENRVNNMWSFNRYTYFLSVFSGPVPWIFNHLRGISFKKYCIFTKKGWKRKSSTGLRVCSLFPSSVIVFLHQLLWAFTRTEQILHSNGASSRLLCSMEKESRNDECWSFVSTDFFFFFKREGGDVDVSIPTRVSRKKTNPTTKPIFIVFIFSFMGRKGVGVYLYIFFIVLSFVKPIKACVNF